MSEEKLYSKPEGRLLSGICRLSHVCYDMMSTDSPPLTKKEQGWLEELLFANDELFSAITWIIGKVGVTMDDRGIAKLVEVLSSISRAAEKCVMEAVSILSRIPFEEIAKYNRRKKYHYRLSQRNRLNPKRKPKGRR